MEAHTFQEVLNLYRLSILEKIQHLHDLVHIFNAGRNPHLHYISLLGVDCVLAAACYGVNANFIYIFFLSLWAEEEVGDTGGNN